MRGVGVPRWIHRSCALAALAVTFVAATPARAQVVPPPPVPQHADVPLPVWTRPAVMPRAFHLRVTPEAARAQALRQAGLWFASFGGAALFSGGLLYASASDINDLLSTSHIIGKTADGSALLSSTTFDPSLEDERDHRLAASQGLLISGGICFATGAILFTIGQLRLRTLHREHPHDPMPALSGY